MIPDTSSFLYIRIQQNPRHYVDKVAKEQSRTWDETLESYVEVRPRRFAPADVSRKRWRISRAKTSSRMKMMTAMTALHSGRCCD